MNKFLITQSLLSSFNWIFKTEEGYKDFEKVLKKESIKQTNVMLKGIQFENMITAYCEGNPIDNTHEWVNGINKIGNLVRNGAFQIALSKTMIINDVEFLLYGKLDVLKAGIIYDIKFSESYFSNEKSFKLNKYADSPQHPMYFELCPTAQKFVYLISDGKEVFKESYRRSDITPIEQEIKEFMAFLENHNLVDTYCSLWRAKE